MFVAHRVYRAGVELDQAFQDAASVAVRVVAATFEFGAEGSAVGVRRFRAGQRDSVDASVDLGAAK
jgi:hypothetical protein